MKLRESNILLFASSKYTGDFLLPHVKQSLYGWQLKVSNSEKENISGLLQSIWQQFAYGKENTSFIFPIDKAHILRRLICFLNVGWHGISLCYCDLAVNAFNDNKWHLFVSLISIDPCLKNLFYFEINKSSVRIVFYLHMTYISFQNIFWSLRCLF